MFKHVLEKMCIHEGFILYNITLYFFRFTKYESTCVKYFAT